MLIAWIAVIAAIIGALVYLLCNAPTNTKLAELGRLTFAAAMVGLMIACATKAVTLLG